MIEGRLQIAVYGESGETRTPDPLIKSQVLLPTELLTHMVGSIGLEPILIVPQTIVLPLHQPPHIWQKRGESNADERFWRPPFYH